MSAAKDQTSPVSGKLRLGKNLLGRVLRREPGGYVVQFDNYTMEGFVPTHKNMELGEPLEAYFICFTNGRILAGLNPYRDFVATYARLAREGKSYPLGTLPSKAEVALPDNAPTALIFAPHPDDEVIIGALALRLFRQNNWRVIDIAVTLGSKQDRRAERLNELKACCEYIGFGVHSVNPNGLDRINPEGRKDNAAWTQAVDAIVKLLEEHGPRVIFFPHNADWNTTHIGTHHLVVDALAKMPPEFSCFAVETEFWAALPNPNLMVEVGEEELTDLVTALSFHVGEVKRNPYHLSLPAWMVDNVRRGGELILSQGQAAPDITFATLYRVRRWKDGALQDVRLAKNVLLSGDDPEKLFDA